jgi:hypothetical protein
MNDRMPEPKRSDFLPSTRNPFATDIATTKPVGAIANAEQQRAVAEVQARMMIARANPRDPMRCMDLILRDCTRPSLAEAALYQYSRGGSSISGPSIRLAEAIAQRWGNIQSGIKELSRSGGYSECVAYAWCLEVGYYDERQFQVRHWRDTKGGGYALTDERDIYELISNLGQRRKRAVLLTVIPGDVVEAAVQQCEETLHVSADTSPEALARIATAFEGFGVTKTQIEKRCQCRLEAIRPAQVVQLRKIFASLKDGMSDAKDWFEQPNGAWAGVEEQHAASPPPARTAPTRDPEPPKPRGRPRKQQAADDAPSWMDEAPPVTTSAPPDSAPAAQEPAPAPEVEEAPPSASGAFSAWIVDGEGRTIVWVEENDIGEFTDPVAFAKAYMETMGEIRPESRESIRRANQDAVAAACAFPGVMEIISPPACAFPGVMEIISPPAEPSLDLAPVKISPAQETYDRLERDLMACKTAQAVTDLGNSVDFVAAVKTMHAAEPALWSKLQKAATEHKRQLSLQAGE